jgi:serine/threonine-protein kinase
LSTILATIALPERYRVARHVANGGMASVWCADDLLLGRRVAIKLLGDRYTGDPKAVRRFQREARTAARLSAHPHVVTIYDVGQTGAEDGLTQRAFIVMEYLAGGTVADAIRVGEVGQDDALRWIREAASALDFAHGHGVVHRDVKPGNMLLGRGRVLHLADFGIARAGAEDTITVTGEVFGTAAYLSPERALGHPATEAGDRYALAVVAHELLVGERPFVADHFAAQARQHIEDEPPRASERNAALPRTVDKVLAQGMAKRPQDRWASAGEFAGALEHALARTRTPVVAGRADTPPPPVFVSSSPARRPTRAIALASLAAVALAVGLVAGAGHNSVKPLQHTPAAVTAPPKPHVRTVRRAAPSSASATDTSSAATASSPAPPSADALQARGHGLMASGQYGAAIPVLRQALAAAGPGSLTYAYALFDLGRSLRLAGDPQSAIPVLRQRLQIPNQTGVVWHELQLALGAAGSRAPSPTGGATVAPKHDGHGNGHHHDQHGD